jgi:hypothetical protein
MKLCPGCGVRKERDAFYEEATDTVTGLSHLCRDCLASRKTAKLTARNVAGWTVKSPRGVEGTVIRIRPGEEEIVVRFSGTRTVVLPLVRA